MSKSRWDFRDVSLGLQKLRELLLGRKHNLHGRFAPLMAPRTIPQPDIPRGPQYKYSDQYYCNRHVLDSVKPPVVAPIPGPNMDPMRQQPADTISFNCAPTPGPPWWWDGHCYYGYEFTAPACPPQSPCPPPKPVCPPPPPVCPPPPPVCPPPVCPCPPPPPVCPCPPPPPPPCPPPPPVCPPPPPSPCPPFKPSPLVPQSPDKKGH